MLQVGSDDRAPPGATVLLAGLGRLPRTILASLLESVPEFEVVVVGEELEDDTVRDTIGGVARWLDRVDPDVVILGALDAATVDGLRRAVPRHVIFVADRGRTLQCYHLEARARTIRDVSPDELLEIIASTST